MRHPLIAGFITFGLILCSGSSAMANPENDYAGSRTPAWARPASGSVFSAQNNRVHGLIGPDVSHYQGCSIDWNRVATKRRFAFMKATEGTFYTDDCFPNNWLGAKAAGLARGAYDFARPHASTDTARAEARYFVRYVKSFGGFARALPPVLDVEANDDGIDQHAMRHWIRAWIDEIHKHTKRKTVTIYTGNWFWEPNIGAWRPKGALLWASRYPTDASQEARVVGWGRPNWWQFTDGTYGPNPHSSPGIGTSDHSVWLGKKSDLIALTRKP